MSTWRLGKAIYFWVSWWSYPCSRRTASCRWCHRGLTGRLDMAQSNLSYHQSCLSESPCTAACHSGATKSLAHRAYLALWRNRFSPSRPYTLASGPFQCSWWGSGEGMESRQSCCSSRSARIYRWTCCCRVCCRRRQSPSLACTSLSSLGKAWRCRIRRGLPSCSYSEARSDPRLHHSRILRKVSQCGHWLCTCNFDWRQCSFLFWGPRRANLHSA